MTAELNKAATCFVFTWDTKLIAFYSILPLPSGGFDNGYRGHRLVVLPDFQGMGIGATVSEFIGGILASVGRQLFCKTVNPALGIYRESRKEQWQPTSHNLKCCTESEASRMMGGLTRLSYCHKYVGKPIYGYEDLLLNADRMRLNKANENQLSLFD